MHLLIEWCRDVRVRVWVSLKWSGLGWDRQTQGLSLSLGLGLSLGLSLYLILDRRHRGDNLERLARKTFRSF